MSVRGVATGDQHDLRRWAESAYELGEIRVLGHHHRASGARGMEDVEVRRALKREFADAGALDTQVLARPRAERGRELVVEPDCHVTPRRWDEPGDGWRTGGRR